MAKTSVPSPEVKIHWRADRNPKNLVKAIDKLEDKLIKEMDGLIQEASEFLIETIVNNWSGIYPPASEPYESPAVRTGNLDATVKRPLGRGRDARGRFAGGKDIKQINMVFNTELGGQSEVKRSYAIYLEYGTSKMAPRPFLRPAIEELKIRFPLLAKRVRLTDKI